MNKKWGKTDLQWCSKSHIKIWTSSKPLEKSLSHPFFEVGVNKTFLKASGTVLNSKKVQLSNVKKMFVLNEHVAINVFVRFLDPDIWKQRIYCKKRTQRACLFSMKLKNRLLKNKNHFLVILYTAIFLLPKNDENTYKRVVRW